MTTSYAATITLADKKEHCDRCGAQASILASLISGGKLNFCANHRDEHLPKLQILASTIVENNRIADSPTC